MQTRWFFGAALPFRFLVISLLLTLLSIEARTAQVTTAMDQFMAKRGYTTVPLRRTRINRLCADARMNGRHVVCLIDTGAADLIIDTRYTGGLKATGRTSTPGYGLFGRFATNLPTVWVDRFEMSGILFSNQQALVANLHRQTVVKTGSYIPSAPQGEEYDCLVGMLLLRHMHALVDCYAPRLYIRPDDPGSAIEEGVDRSFRASGFKSAPTKPIGTKLFVETLLNDQPAMFVVDTGAFDTLIALDQLEAYHLSNKEQLFETVDLGGKSRDTKYTLPDSLKIGEIELKRYPIGTDHMPIITQHNEELRKRGFSPVVGLLGPDILDHTRALIDCDRERIFLMPEKTAQ